MTNNSSKVEKEVKSFIQKQMARDISFFAQAFIQELFPSLLGYSKAFA